MRERRADIPLLAYHFLEEFNRETGHSLRAPAGALDCLFNYDWPGNVRELRAAVRLSAAFADAEGFISTWHLAQATQRGRKRKQAGGSLPSDANYFVPYLRPTVLENVVSIWSQWTELHATRNSTAKLSLPVGQEIKTAWRARI